MGSTKSSYWIINSDINAKKSFETLRWEKLLDIQNHDFKLQLVLMWKEAAKRIFFKLYFKTCQDICLIDEFQNF